MEDVPKNPVKKKRNMKKAGSRKISSKKRKRVPKMRLPRNSSKKVHVVMMFQLLNSITDTARGECLEMLTPYTPKERVTDHGARIITGMKKLLAKYDKG